jgi:hypothetical protein
MVTYDFANDEANCANVTRFYALLLQDCVDNDLNIKKNGLFYQLQHMELVINYNFYY